LPEDRADVVDAVDSRSRPGGAGADAAGELRGERRARPLPNHAPLTIAEQFAVGTVDEVRRYLEQFAESVQADEVIVAHHAVDVTARLRSVELTASILV